MPTLFRGVRLRTVFAFAVVVGVILFFAVSLLRPRTYSLRITGGDTLGRRHQLASLLAEEALSKGVRLTVRETMGSGEAMKRLKSGDLDLALIQGGQEPVPGVKQVAMLTVEPLHLLVKPAFVGKGLLGLRGRRLNLSTPESGTRRLSKRVLTFLGMEAGRDFVEENRPYVQLDALSPGALPEAIFLVSTLPSPVAEKLIRRHGYRFLPLPYGEALNLRDIAIVPTTVPAFAYGAVPPVPENTVPTVGNRLLLVAADRVAPEAVRRTLEALRSPTFLHRANLPEIAEETLLRSPEMPIHRGATDFLHRNHPAFTSDDMQGLDSLRNLIASLLVGGYLLWRWAVRRRYHGMELYMQEVAKVEKAAMAEEEKATPDLGELLYLRHRLSEIKAEALEQFGNGRLRGEELLTGFLTHVADVRAYVTALMLSERDRLAELSSQGASEEEARQRFQKDWDVAVGSAPVAPIAPAEPTASVDAGRTVSDPSATH
ncbi:MAG: TAXI family TRAP transporter solute-binding subunit [Capsulimonadales bacterium]|nr:TAXI family TRAP transporter solute-binding subunit [Capsulimonadales bacterium]